jgi:hypothetical protein
MVLNFITMMLINHISNMRSNRFFLKKMYLKKRFLDVQTCTSR